MTTLQSIIVLATDVNDMPISKLTSEPKACGEIVQKVQTIGKAWDDHPDWHGRSWYVQVLLAVASLSRVVEWFEAERQFWNFEGDEGDEVSEPLTFVLKPQTREGVPTRSGSGSAEAASPPNSEEASRAPSIRSKRAFHSGSLLNDQAPTPSAQDVQFEYGAGPRPSISLEPTEASRQEATETLRLQVEEAQSLNIVVELTLDGEGGEQQFAWINPAWFDVIGCGWSLILYTSICLIF
jgi:serine/threonine-protein kinase RIM15